MRRVGIVGAGNLGNHLTGLLKLNNISPTISDIDPNKSHSISKQYNIDQTNNAENIRESDIIFLTVKPNNVKDICNQISDIEDRKIIVSTAAGVPTDKIDKWSGYQHHIVRCMPNIPISKGMGSIIWYYLNDDEMFSNINILKNIMVGPKSYWAYTEDTIDIATVVSGCIPAYISRFFKAYVDIGIEMGFSPEDSKQLLIQSMLGTVKLLEEMEPESIIEQVASKGGATEKGLEMIEKAGFDNIIKKSAYRSLLRISNITQNLD